MGLSKLFGSKPKDTTSKDGKKKAKALSVKRTVQQMVPYVTAYSNGIFELPNHKFSKTYKLGNINFVTAESEQEDLFSNFCDMINAVSDCAIEISSVNRPADVEEFKEKYFLRFKHDGMDKYRQEYNTILLDNLEKNTSVISDKYLTLTISADDEEVATQQFVRIDGTVVDAVGAIGGSVATPLSTEERLAILHGVYHAGEKEAFVCDLANLKSQGATTKDLVAPSSMTVYKNHMEVGENLFSTLYLAVFPSSLTTNFIEEMNALPFSSITSVHLSAISQDRAQKMIRNQITNISANIQTRQRKATGRGSSGDFVSPDLMNAHSEAVALLDDVNARNQKLFYATVVVTVVAEDEEYLDRYVKMVQAVGRKHVCAMRKLGYQQDIGLDAALPLGQNSLAINRLLTTETAGLFIPYTSETLSHENGLYYGINPISRDMILFDRLSSKNANGMILGTPGSGKSFIAKRVMLGVYFGTDADQQVIDPEGEYGAMAKLLNGQVIRIAPGSDNHINPMDMDMRSADKDDPVTLKADYVCSFCETAMGGRYGLNPIQKSIIDRCVRLVYKPYLEYMSKHPELNCCPEECPTLVDFYETLLAQPEPEAQSIALSLETYAVGSLDVFAHKTNIDANNRFVVYDIRDIGTNLKELGLQVCLNTIWNKTIENRTKLKYTWSYIDEMHLLLQHESSASYVRQLFKRARKFWGVPTGLTQNVEDLLASPEARSVLNNCDFVVMLNQSPLDKVALSEMFHINTSMQQYITNVGYGHGLIYTGKTIVPFEDNYPKDTESFKAMTTNPKDIADIAEESKGEQAD